MLQVGIYADDLTGALDAAAPFAREGMRAYVSLIGTVPAGLSDLYQVCSLNIDSRRAAQFAPFERASRAARELRAAGASLVFNKLDSTGRGHFGMEARGGLSPEPSDPMAPRGPKEWRGPRVALLAPAYPAMRRTVSGGVLYVKRRPVTETDVGRDALTPVHSSDLREVVFQNVGVRPRLFPIGEVRDPGRLLNGVRELAKTPPAVALADAETCDDLRNLARIAFEMPGEVVLGGSAGLTSVLAEAIAATSESLEPAPTYSQSKRAGAVVMIAGSQRENTAAQVERLVGLRRVSRIRVAGDVLLDDESADSERDRILSDAYRAVTEGVDVVLTLDAGHAERVEYTEAAVRDRLVGELGAILYRLSARTPLEGLALIGGDTAQGALRAVGAAGIVLEAEPLPGVPAGVIDAGILKGIPVATKAGDFGDEDTLINIIDHLKGRA